MAIVVGLCWGRENLSTAMGGQPPMRGHSLTVALMLSVPVLSAAAGFAGVPTDSRILFARNTDVPRPVQEFAWRVIETHCAYQSYERRQRSFWAYEAHTRKTDVGVVYSIRIVSDLTWKKTQPSAFIAMTIVDNGRLQLTSLKSSFIACEIY
jgi:hypothetical protein